MFLHKSRHEPQIAHHGLNLICSNSFLSKPCCWSFQVISIHRGHSATSSVLSYFESGQQVTFGRSSSWSDLGANSAVQLHNMYSTFSSSPMRPHCYAFPMADLKTQRLVFEAKMITKRGADFKWLLSTRTRNNKTENFTSTSQHHSTSPTKKRSL